MTEGVSNDVHYRVEMTDIRKHIEEIINHDFILHLVEIDSCFPFTELLRLDHEISLIYKFLDDDPTVFFHFLCTLIGRDLKHLVEEVGLDQEKRNTAVKNVTELLQDVLQYHFIINSRIDFHCQHLHS